MRVELESRQNQLLGVMDQVDRFLRAPGAVDVAAVGELRVVSDRMLAEHYRFKEEVFVRLRECGTVAADRQVARSRSAMLALQVAHRFHLADWTADAIARNWLGFVVAAHGLTQRVRALIAKDRAYLYPLIDQIFAGTGGGAAEEPHAHLLSDTLERLGHTSVAA